MTKAVKLADIAERVGVSTVTVSKALSGQKGVSEEMREKIKKLAEELGYRSPSAVRGEVGKPRSYHIGVLVEEGYLDQYESFYWKLYQQVSACALERECFAVLEVVSGRMEEELELPKVVREKKVHGLIVIGRMAEEYRKLLKENKSLPVVYIDFSDDDPETDAVISDNYYGACRLVNYLIEQGHTRIAYVGTLLASGSITDRYFGYAKALLEHGLPLREDWRLNDRQASSVFIREELMQLPEEMPTAFFCNCDLTAGKLIRKLQQEGYRVPEDISVVGFDNYIYPGICDVGITTYEVNQAEMAAQAVKTLIRRLEGETAGHRTHIVEGRVVVKESVRGRKIS
ncbi:MAG: LacI family DNA-binding transcriptional regulator [Roseburia sp.]|nr:LacI family DNA-binding transcriptional regulator [Roseburia sp.]MCM1099405.1 LacI family DNA-binding transcriptional regulator [Ruminococcus flavefaciens]MCM1233481.1 LacI family DNA-binding transcriptional regulator [Ruminococcus flavefaciens]